MGQHTYIEYCDSSVNPTSGCDGCELWTPGKGGSCYAGGIHTRFRGKPAYPGPFDQVDLQPGRMAVAAGWPDLRGKPRLEKRNKKGEIIEHAKPWLDGMPRVIFISDMADALSAAVPFEYLRDEVIAHVDSPAGRRHFWLWLTKQPKRMADFDRWLEEQGIEWPANLMPGTSLTSMRSLGRISQIMRGRFSFRWLSCEPMLGPIEFGNLLLFDDECPASVGIDWIVCGGASGKGATPMHPDWPRSIRDTCAAAGVPFFFKQWGDWAVCNRENGFIEHVMQEGTANKFRWIGIDGRTQNPSANGLENAYAVGRKGKKHAGRLLDGVEHNAIPLLDVVTDGLLSREAVTHA